jgi:hypothetical protein
MQNGAAMPTDRPTRETIKAAAKDRRIPVTDLLALAPKNDPFYVGGPADITRGRWFADVFNAAGYAALHLRRLHYWTASQRTPIPMPDGMPYTNTHACWEFITEASKAARYLDFVPLTGITDNKNPAPHLHANYEYGLAPEFEIGAPDLSAPDVSIYLPHPANAQPYHLEIWCEKSTMNDVLMPICSQYYANLVTFEGEASITAIMVGLMRRIREADRPTRIFYISDFDPAGNSMPVATSRKLEYAISRAGRDYDVKVRPLALTRDQVATYRLPRIPIKETETRAAAFESAFGSGAVELDALEALYPGVLADLADNALRPYHSDEAERLRDQRARELETALRAKVDAITARYQAEIDALASMLQELRAVDVNTAPYTVETFPPDVDEDDDWLYDSERAYEDQIGHYKAHKAGTSAQAVPS